MSTSDPASATRAPAAHRVRVPVSDLGPGETRVFSLAAPGGGDDSGTTGFVVHHEGQLHAWVNRCPHVPYSLDLGDGRLLSADRTAVVCSNHGAQFDPSTGLCVLGPPRGRRLAALALERDGDDAVVTVPSALARG